MNEEKRHNTRHTLRTKMDYRAQSGGDFLFEYTTNISRGGIFIETRDPLPEGTIVEMKFQPPGAEAPIEVSGKVVWVNRWRDGEDNHNPGMGIQFEELAEDNRELLAQLVKAIAYL
jgi:type IV pilus assembly protein PilZ